MRTFCFIREFKGYATFCSPGSLIHSGFSYIELSKNSSPVCQAPIRRTSRYCGKGSYFVLRISYCCFAVGIVFGVLCDAAPALTRVAELSRGVGTQYPGRAGSNNHHRCGRACAGRWRRTGITAQVERSLSFDIRQDGRVGGVAVYSRAEAEVFYIDR